MEVDTSEKALTDAEIIKIKQLDKLNASIKQWKRTKAWSGISCSDRINGIIEGLETAKTIIKSN